MRQDDCEFKGFDVWGVSGVTRSLFISINAEAAEDAEIKRGNCERYIDK